MDLTRKLIGSLGASPSDEINVIFVSSLESVIQRVSLATLSPHKIVLKLMEPPDPGLLAPQTVI